MKSGSLSFWTAIASIPSVFATSGHVVDALKYINDPPGSAYIAAFPPGHPVQGGIIATSAEGAGTQFTVDFTNLPAEGGPFRGLSPLRFGYISCLLG
jgi:hypothetical protein